MSSNFFRTPYFLLLISLGYVATDIYLPSLPALSAYFQVGDNEAQMTLTVYLASFSLTPLLFGPLSDHIGRKKVILFGILVSILATISCLFAQTIDWLIVSRFFQGIGTGAVLISARASISDLYTGHALARQMSYLTMLMPLVLSLAPTLGGALQQTYGWKSIFIFLIFFMVFLLICVFFNSETKKALSHEKIRHIFSTYRSHLKNRLFVSYGINFIIPSLGLFAYMTTSPFLFQEIIGLTPIEYGSLSLFIGGTILVSGYINLKLIPHFSLTKIMCFGGCLVLLAGISLLIFTLLGVITTWSLLIPSLLFFTCLPFCITNAISKSLGCVKSHFGSATALATTFQFLVGALGSLIFSLIADETSLSLAVCFIAIAVLYLTNLYLSIKLEKKNALSGASSDLF